MTIEWILGLIRPTSAIVNGNVGEQNIINNNNNHFPSDMPMSGSGTRISDIRPILTNQYPPDSPSLNSNLNNFNSNDPLFRDGYQVSFEYLQEV